MLHTVAHSASPTTKSRAENAPIWNAISYGISFAIAIVSWRARMWPITVLCWLPIAYFGHAIMMAMHEAAHGNLRSNKWDNELHGRMIGYLTLVPLSAYRAVHMTHHRYLAEPRDTELWPYTDPQMPRWSRILFAWGEIVAGLIVTPLLFVHGVLATKSLRPAQRHKIAKDYVVMLALWAVILACVAIGGDWKGFVMVFLIPAVLAATIQTLRKFTEHLGMLANTPEEASRTINDNSLVGQFLSATMLNISYHAFHHRYASIPYYELPRASAEAIASDPDDNQVFSSYWQAFLNMMPALADPKVGGQWLQSNGVVEQECRRTAERVRAYAKASQK